MAFGGGAVTKCLDEIPVIDVSKIVDAEAIS
jgi:hypothetical protein